MVLWYMLERDNHPLQTDRDDAKREVVQGMAQCWAGHCLPPHMRFQVPISALELFMEFSCRLP
jgi:hypothetical protein